MTIFADWTRTYRRTTGQMDGQTDSQGDYRTRFESQPFSQSIFLRVVQLKTWNDSTTPLLCGGQITLSKNAESCPLAIPKKVREKSRECHNHNPQPFPDPKRKRKPTNLNKHKPNKRTKSTKIRSLFPKWGNRNTKRTEKHKNKMTHGKTYNKSPRGINHKATRSKTNLRTVGRANHRGV